MADGTIPRERWTAIFERKQSDRPPLDYWATDEVTDKLMRHLKATSLRDLYQKLEIDVPITVEPKYVGPPIPSDEDVLGCKYRDVNYGTGSYRECVTHLLSDYRTVEEIEANYTWPDIDDYDFSTIKEQTWDWHDYPISGGGSEPFLDYKNLRDQQQGYIDLFRYPEIAEYCLDIGHSNLFNNTSLGFVYTLRDHLSHIHIHDNNGGDSEAADIHLAPGKGNIDFDQIFNALKTIGYDQTIILEMTPMDSLERKAESLRRVREMIHKSKHNSS